MAVYRHTTAVMAELRTPGQPKKFGSTIEFSTGIMVPMPSIANKTVLKNDGIPKCIQKKEKV